VHLGEALAHDVLEGDCLGTEEVGGPEFEDAEPVVVGELEGDKGLVTVWVERLWEGLETYGGGFGRHI
jgi:hypothetical protein